MDWTWQLRQFVLHAGLERVDYIRSPAGTLGGVPVMGTVVVDDGNFTRWTDYFDVSLTVKILRGEDISALVPAI